jgi:uncharacterized Fe-S cluster-containing radical SAM superfamily protein
MSRETNLSKRRKRKSAYDPVKRAGEVAKVVCRGDQRKYHRVRAARFYGGIATADCVGCCLRCLFCWSWPKVISPERYGRFYTPEEVAAQLTHIVRKKGFHQARISGNEPTIAREHLIKVLERIPLDIRFILETNGIPIGDDYTYAVDLARFKNLYVRISLKGCDEAEFSALTGALPQGFELQLQALANLCRTGVNVHPAVMVSFSPSAKVRLLRKKLGAIRREFEHIEIEELVLYGDVEKRLRKAGIEYRSAYSPSGIPSDQV